MSWRDMPSMNGENEPKRSRSASTQVPSAYFKTCVGLPPSTTLTRTSRKPTTKLRRNSRIGIAERALCSVCSVSHSPKSGRLWQEEKTHMGYCWYFGVSQKVYQKKKINFHSLTSNSRALPGNKKVKHSLAFRRQRPRPPAARSGKFEFPHVSFAAAAKSCHPHGCRFFSCSSDRFDARFCFLK